VFRTLFAFLAVTAGVMTLVGLERRGEIGPGDAQAVALDEDPRNE
jgi:hypothetical protein